MFCGKIRKVGGEVPCGNSIYIIASTNFTHLDVVEHVPLDRVSLWVEPVGPSQSQAWSPLAAKNSRAELRATMKAAEMSASAGSAARKFWPRCNSLRPPWPDALSKAYVYTACPCCLSLNVIIHNLGIYLPISTPPILSTISLTISLYRLLSAVYLYSPVSAYHLRLSIAAWGRDIRLSRDMQTKELQASERSVS